MANFISKTINMKLLIPFLFIIGFAQAQTNDILLTIQRQSKVKLVQSYDLQYQAKANASEIMTSYDISLEEVNITLDKINEQKWFYGIDVFIGNDLQEVMENIERDNKAYYIKYPNSKVIIDVSHDYEAEYCLVTIYTMI